MKNTIKSIIAAIILVSACACDFQREADAKFGDQHFKTAIALIELHKVRFGAYPDSLKDIKYAGDWDAIINGTVEYKKLENGYELNITRGWVGSPSLKYPPDFWRGLGVVKSNVKHDSK